MSNPKAFISYSWTTPEHEEWVLNLATDLRNLSVDVILDKWDLKEGHDTYAFMEKIVTDPDINKVIIVCDRGYAEKANERKKGAGAEAQIITSELYGKVEQNKFVAIIREKDSENNAILPVFFKSRIYIDFSQDEEYSSNIEQLTRWIYDKPIYKKPPLGKIPSFINEEETINLGTSTLFRRAIDAVRNSKPYANSAVKEYFSLFVEKLNEFRLQPSNGKPDFDEDIVESFKSFIPYRNEIIEMITTIARHSEMNQSNLIIHDFIEKLASVIPKQDNLSYYHKWDWDNLRLIAHEVFLYIIAIFINESRFDLLYISIQTPYYVKNLYNNIYEMDTFTYFYNSIPSLEHRNKRLQLNRTSIHADLLKDRCSGINIKFKILVQADFFLFIVDSINSLKTKQYQSWWPITLVYSSELDSGMEIFTRSESKSYFDLIRSSLGIENKSELQELLDAFQKNSLKSPNFGYFPIEPFHVIKIDKLCSRP